MGLATGGGEKKYSAVVEIFFLLYLFPWIVLYGALLSHSGQSAWSLACSRLSTVPQGLVKSTLMLSAEIRPPARSE